MTVATAWPIPNSGSASSSHVVYLVEAGRHGGGPALALLAGLIEQSDHPSTVVLLGNGDLSRHAAAAGLEGLHRVGIAYNNPLLGLAAIRHRLRQLPAAGQFVCLSPAGTLAARLVRPGTPRTFLATQTVTQAEAAMLRACFRWPGSSEAILPTSVAAVGAAVHEHLVRGALGPFQHAISHLPVPAVQAGERGGDVPSRGELRERWGLADERTRVVALVSDPPTGADAQAGALAVALTHTVLADARWPGRVALLMHPDQRRRAQAQRMVEMLDAMYPIILEPELETPWRVLAGCDVVLAMGGGAEAETGLAVGLAMAAGLPIVASPGPGAAARLEHGRTAMMARDASSRCLAHQLTGLLRSPDTAGRLRLAARHEAARRRGRLAMRVGP